VRRNAKQATKFGAIYFGSSTPSMNEARDILETEGIHIDAMRVKSFPFCDEVIDFVAAHEQVFVVEQNRDGQLRTLLINEGHIDPGKLPSVRHYDGTPITARFIVSEISMLMGRPKSRVPEAAE
jgi:2-oxoglutarate ferredoxin oxidoreductase subunit alpha